MTAATLKAHDATTPHHRRINTQKSNLKRSRTGSRTTLQYSPNTPASQYRASVKQTRSYRR